MKTTRSFTHAVASATSTPDDAREPEIRRQPASEERLVLPEEEKRVDVPRWVEEAAAATNLMSAEARNEERVDGLPASSKESQCSVGWTAEMAAGEAEKRVEVPLLVDETNVVSNLLAGERKQEQKKDRVGGEAAWPKDSQVGSAAAMVVVLEDKSIEIPPLMEAENVASHIPRVEMKQEDQEEVDGEEAWLKENREPVELAVTTENEEIGGEEASLKESVIPVELAAVAKDGEEDQVGGEAALLKESPVSVPVGLTAAMAVTEDESTSSEWEDEEFELLQKSGSVLDL